MAIRLRSKMASVAAVILNYNGEAHLRRFLPSVVEHTPDWVDIIVADNGSSDDSRRVVIEEFAPRIEYRELGRNWGFAEGYNRALEALEQDIFILLNSDVEVTKGWLEPLVEELLASDDVAIVGSKLRSLCEPSMFEYAGAAGGYIDYLGYPFCRGRILSTIEQDEGQYDDSRDLFWVSGAALGCRASVFREMGGFDGDFFAHQEEIDLCWRVQLAGYRVRYVAQSVVYHLGGGTLATESAHKTMLNHRNNLAMLYKCAPTMQRCVVAIIRPALDFVSAVSYLAKGRMDMAKGVFLAWRDFIVWHGALRRKRKAIRTTTVRESQHIYGGAVALNYLLGRRTYRDNE